MFQSVTESLAIGNVISAEELSEVAQKGYRTIIDLCLPSEEKQLNVAEVENLGFNLIKLPLDRQNLNPEVLPGFMQAVNSAPQPVYIRCASGLRAGVMSLLTLASQHNWTEQQYLEKREALGLKHQPNCPLEVFAREQFQVKNA